MKLNEVKCVSGLLAIAVVKVSSRRVCTLYTMGCLFI